MSTGPKVFVANEGYHGQYSSGKPDDRRTEGEVYQIEGNVERVNPRVSTYLYNFCAGVEPRDTVLNNALEERTFTTNVSVKFGGRVRCHLYPAYHS